MECYYLKNNKQVRISFFRGGLLKHTLLNHKNKKTLKWEIVVNEQSSNSSIDLRLEWLKFI